MTINNAYSMVPNKKKIITNCASIKEVETVVLELKFQIYEKTKIVSRLNFFLAERIYKVIL